MINCNCILDGYKLWQISLIISGNVGKYGSIMDAVVRERERYMYGEEDRKKYRELLLSRDTYVNPLIMYIYLFEPIISGKTFCI